MHRVPDRPLLKGVAFERFKSIGANGDREISIFPVQLTTSRIGKLTRLIYTRYSAIYDDHTTALLYL